MLSKTLNVTQLEEMKRCVRISLTHTHTHCRGIDACGRSSGLTRSHMGGRQAWGGEAGAALCVGLPMVAKAHTALAMSVRGRELIRAHAFSKD